MTRIRRFPLSAADTRAPSGETAAYVLDSEETGVLVDPAARSPDLDRAVETAAVEHVLVTHAHPDHVGAVAPYADDWNATVWCRRGYEDRLEAACGVGPDRTFVEGSTVGPARVIDTPGHAPDHVALAVPEDGEGDGTDRSLVVGDLAVAEGSVVVGAPEGDLRAYLTTLRRLRVRSARRWYPAHGPIIEAPRQTAERLLAHRLERERRVQEAVRCGARTVDAVVDAAYDKDVRHVADLARATIRAHLEKLAVEGDVSLDGDWIEPVSPA